MDNCAAFVCRGDDWFPGRTAGVGHRQPPEFAFKVWRPHMMHDCRFDNREFQRKSKSGDMKAAKIVES
jgi:hypothetical protein